MNLRDYKTIKERRTTLEQALGVALSNIGHFSLDETVASTRNCENMIGVAQVPMGVAGPLLIKRQKTSDKQQAYYLPLATTEGALVASVSRGCKAITESGGAAVASHRVGATRGPVFYCGSIVKGLACYEWIKTHTDVLAQAALQTSRHLRLQKTKVKTVGQYVFVRFYFDTQDAMGMNMATIATEAMAQIIQEQAHVRCISVAGNFDNDKKPSWLNIVANRGIKAWADVTIPATVLTETLKTTASAIYEVWLAKCMIGSAMAGSLGFNAQFANVIAAIFLATGQDVGHVAEGSCGITTTEVVNDDLYISVYLPDLMVGTVGGGTGLATQQEALSLLGVAGGDAGKNAERLAQVVAAVVLAGEISLLASLSEGTLAKAHERLARGTK